MEGPNLTVTLGAAFIGYLFAAILYGGTCVQTFVYYRVNHRDGPALKVSILIMWFLDTFHLALLSHTLYTYVVLNFTNVFALLIPTWSLSAQVIVSAITEVFVRLVFTSRVWKLSGRNKLLTGLLCFMSLFVFVVGIYFGFRSFYLGTFLNFPSLAWLVYLAFGAALLSDIALTASLCVLLWRNRTGFAVTDSILRTLTIYTVNTGFFTCVITAAVLITFAVNPLSFVFIALYFVLSKTFLNALLASLNLRELIFGEYMEAVGGAKAETLRATSRQKGDIPIQYPKVPMTRLGRHLSMKKTEGSHDDILEIRVETSTLCHVESASSKSAWTAKDLSAYPTEHV